MVNSMSLESVIQCYVPLVCFLIHKFINRSCSVVREGFKTTLCCKRDGNITKGKLDSVLKQIISETIQHTGLYVIDDNSWWEVVSTTQEIFLNEDFDCRVSSVVLNCSYLVYTYCISHIYVWQTV